MRRTLLIQNQEDLSLHVNERGIWAYELPKEYANNVGENFNCLECANTQTSIVYPFLLHLEKKENSYIVQPERDSFLYTPFWFSRFVDVNYINGFPCHFELEKIDYGLYCLSISPLWTKICTGILSVTGVVYKLNNRDFKLIHIDDESNRILKEF